MEPYNPLDKKNLGRSVADALLDTNLVELPAPESRSGFVGAGVYALYYFGTTQPFPPYQRLIEHNRISDEPIPIYVGKAIPRGARTAGVGPDAEPGTVLFDRLRDHAESIYSASNLRLADFRCRYLRVDDIWIPLGESLLIQRFRPVWNVLVGGFGNHDPGGGRGNQRRSQWDTLHSGRAWAKKLTRPNQLGVGEIIERVEEYLAGQTVPVKSTEQAIEDEDC